MAQSEIAKVRAMSSPMRVKILKLLKSRPYTLSEIARELHISKTNSNVHLRKLLAAGLVDLGEKRGKWRYYSLKQEYRSGINLSIPLVSLAFAIVSFWQAMLNRFAVVSPDHEFTELISFTPAGYVFLFIAFLAGVAFVISCALLLHKRLKSH